MFFFPVAGLFGGFVPFLLAPSLPVPHLPGYNKVTLEFLVKKTLEIHMEPSWFLVLGPKKLILEKKFCSNMTPPSLKTGPPSHYIVIELGNCSKIRFDWPWINACALHFGWSFQGYLTWPYLARSNTGPNTVFGVMGSIFEFPKQGDFLWNTP